jgi:hypothetical protein
VDGKCDGAATGDEVGVIDMSGSLCPGPGVVGGICVPAPSPSAAVPPPLSSRLSASYGDGYSANLGFPFVAPLRCGGLGVLPLTSPLSNNESSPCSYVSCSPPSACTVSSPGCDVDVAYVLALP